MSQMQINQGNVLEVAGKLIEERGFDTITLADIADHTDTPLEFLEREYCCKEMIALLIYQQLSEQSFADAQQIEPASISEMYYDVLEHRLWILGEHMEVTSSLYANAMRPHSQITASDIAAGMGDPVMQIMQDLAGKSTNPPLRDADDLSLFLYAFHYLVIVFWLYDRTEDKAASHMLTGFMRELVKIMRPMLVLPMVSKALTKVSKIMMVVFGGARIVETSSGTTQS